MAFVVCVGGQGTAWTSTRGKAEAGGLGYPRTEWHGVVSQYNAWPNGEAQRRLVAALLPCIGSKGSGRAICAASGGQRSSRAAPNCNVASQRAEVC